MPLAHELVYETVNRSPFFGTPDPDLAGQLRAAAAAGFRWSGLDRGTIADFLARHGSLADLAKLFEASGVRCFAIQDVTVVADPRETLAHAEHVAEVARALRPPWIHMCCVTALDARALDTFRRATDALRPSGARFALEFLPWCELNGIAATRDFLRRAQVPEARMLVDTWHFTHGPSTFEELASLAPDEIAYVQFDDHPPLASDDLFQETCTRRALPGAGTFELARFAGALRGNGYRGPVSVEVINDEMRAWPPETFARRAFEAAAPFWSEA
jgi:sugar phosphate isomerase/epimerase